MDVFTAARALAELTGRLQPAGGSTDSDLGKARELVAHCLLLDQAEPLFPPDDPFGLAKADELDPAELVTLREICQRAADDIQGAPGLQLEIRAFRRAISTTADLEDAGPPWAAGAVANRTIGPFVNPDGRPFWFSMYATPRLVPIARAGGAAPVLFVSLGTPPQPSTSYDLAAGSVWIAADALASGAPGGAYCGLRIASGSIALDSVATIAAGTIVIPAGALLRLDLKLDPPVQPVVADVSPLHPGRIEADYPAKVRVLLSPGAADVSMLAAKLRVFGADVALKRNPKQPPVYRRDINRILVPCTASVGQLDLAAASTLLSINGSARIAGSAWALPVARVAKPVTGAAGAGGLALSLDRGGVAKWLNLNADVSIASTELVFEPQGTSLTASASVEPHARQRFALWADRASVERRCSVELRHGPRFPFHFRIEADGSEALAIASFCAAHLDRPVGASGVRLPIHAPDALAVFFVGTGTGRCLLLRCTPVLPNVAFALSNGLILAGPPASFLLFGEIGVAENALKRGATVLQANAYSVVPMLPDPYADNLTGRREPPRPVPRALFRSRTRWTDPNSAPVMTFRLDPIQGTSPSLQELYPAVMTTHEPQLRPVIGNRAVLQEDTVRRKALQDRFTGTLASVSERFLLLDVSSNADQLGVGFGSRPSTVAAVELQPSRTLIQGLSLVTLGRDLCVFTVPQFQWELVWTIQNPNVMPFPFPSPLASANDGGPTLLGTNSVKFVPIAPQPLVSSLVSEFRGKDGNFFAAALFTLPFGMHAVATPLRVPLEPLMPGASFDLIRPRSNQLQVAGGLQVSLTATDPRSTPESESPSLQGFAIQTRNSVDPISGVHLALSVLGDVVDGVFNKEFGPGGSNPRVPVTRIDFSGYGASLYSDWRNPKAESSQTSEVRFDVVVGRTAHEVVQIRSTLYGCAARVVRTITIQRTGAGGVYRRDSGWVAASDGLFQFPAHRTPTVARIETHPGVVRGVFNIRRIRDTTHEFDRMLPGPGGPVRVRLAAVRFDCEVLLSDVIAGGSGGFVTSVDQVGFIQLEPQGDPLTVEQYAELLAAEGPLGGPVDCLMDVGGSGQRMRITRVDVATAPKPPGGIEFAAAARGSLLLPKDGQWSFCRQPDDSTRECEPLDPHTGAPLVREGRATVPEATNTTPYRFAEPADLLANTSGGNIALLWSTGTQRLLFSRSRIAKGSKSITSDVPPLLSDPFSTVSSGAPFPSALTCLRVPFANYSLEVPGESQLRLVLPTATFAAQPVSGNLRRELSTGSSTRLLADYTNTRITVLLDSSAPNSFSYDETGVALVQEEDGVHAKTSRGRFHASSVETTRWTLEAEEFGPLFDTPKNIMPMFASSNLAGSLSPGGSTVPLDTTAEAHGPNPKIGVRIKWDVPEHQPMFIGTTTGGHIEGVTDFQSFGSIEAVVGICVAKVFPGGVFFKFESKALKRPAAPGSDNKLKAGSEQKLILSIGVYKDGHFLLTPYPLEAHWAIFVGIAFTHDAKPGEKSVGVGIVFIASGSVQYPPGKFSLAEVGVKVEGQGLIEFRGGNQFLILKGSIALEFTVAYVLDIEWEIVEGTVYESEI